MHGYIEYEELRRLVGQPAADFAGWAFSGDCPDMQVLHLGPGPKMVEVFPLAAWPRSARRTIIRVANPRRLHPIAAPRIPMEIWLALVGSDYESSWLLPPPREAIDG